MTEKYLDLVVRAGKYYLDGEEKSRWQSVGKLFLPAGDKGYMVLLNKTFNPAGVPGLAEHEESGQVYIYCFTPKNDQGKLEASRSRLKRRQHQIEDDIPF